MTDIVETERQRRVLINSASRADLGVIEKILRGTVQTPYGSGQVEEAEVKDELERINKALDSSEEGQILIARDEGNEVLGLAFFGKPDQRLADFVKADPTTTVELRLLYLDPDKRKRGIGSSLLEKVEETARNTGMHRIVLSSGPRYILIGSGSFYLKRGFRSIGTIANYFEGKYWARVFQKELD
ncbi:MAG: GNAT family N-acetyltransferase [Pseudomonadota bacterium]